VRFEHRAIAVNQPRDANARAARGAVASRSHSSNFFHAADGCIGEEHRVMSENHPSDSKTATSSHDDESGHGGPPPLKPLLWMLLALFAVLAFGVLVK
jgi:hypothetical protein